MLRVATLNLWNRHEPWDARLRAIREGLRALAPDVCGLQEVLHPCVEGLGPDQATQVAEGLGYHVAFGPAWELGGVEFGNAVLSRWPIVETRTLALPDGGTDESRCLVFASIDAPFGRLPFFVTHLNWKLDEGHVRERQVRAVAEHVASLAPTSGFPPVLVGDFNAEPGSDEVRFLRLLRGFFPEGLSQREEGERLQTALGWIREYVLEQRLPALGTALPDVQTLTTGTDGFVLATTQGTLVEGWVELYRQGHLRGALFGARVEDRPTVLVARKSFYVSFDLGRAAHLLNELEAIAGGSSAWEASGDWMWGPPTGTYVLASDILAVLLRC